MAHYKIRLNLPDDPDEPAAVIRARELANAMREPVFIIDAASGRNGAIPANQFHRNNFEGVKILAIGYPAGWRYMPHRGGDVR